MDDRHLPSREQFKSDFEAKTLQLKLVSGQIDKIKDLTAEASTIKKALADNDEALMVQVEKGEISLLGDEFHYNKERIVLRQLYQNLIQTELI